MKRHLHRVHENEKHGTVVQMGFKSRKTWSRDEVSEMIVVKLGHHK